MPCSVTATHSQVRRALALHYFCARPTDTAAPRSPSHPLSSWQARPSEALGHLSPKRLSVQNASAVSARDICTVLKPQRAIIPLPDPHVIPSPESLLQLPTSPVR
eukprot:926256-Pleurochrysis_carterae.AAC.1